MVTVMKQRVSLIFTLLMVHLSTPVYGDDSLNAGYAKLLALSSTDDISASSLTADKARYAKYSLPYRFDELYKDSDYTLSLLLRGNYLTVKPEKTSLESQGTFHPRWDIMSVTASPQIAYNINESLTLESELEFGYAYMSNKSTFHGNAETKDVLYREGLLGWSTNTLHITPKIGLSNVYELDNSDEITIRGHLAYMFMKGVKNEKKLNINSNTGIWSAGAEYAIPDIFRFRNTPFSLIISNDIGGFYGRYYRELSFGFINTTALALEAPVDFYDNNVKVKIGIGYLSSDNAEGMTLLFEIR